jgi:putative FmdB family regulatory protein
VTSAALRTECLRSVPGLWIIELLSLDTSECQTRRQPRIPVPTYQYACTECGHEFETVQSFTDPTLSECPECSGRLRKVYGAVGVVFKGSGFYRTDSRAAAKAGSKANGSATKPETTGTKEAAAAAASESSSKSAGDSGGAAKAASSSSNGSGTSSTATPKSSASTTAKSS